MTLVDACGADPSVVCEHVYDWTGNKTAAVVADWFVAKPVAIAGVVIGALILTRILRWLIKRSMERVMSRPDGDSRSSWLRNKTPDAWQRSTESSERVQARGQTLIAVFRSLAAVAVWIVAVVWILEILQINLAPLVAGTAIIGAALGFGAQNVVRDFLAGFFIVVEDQFGVGDVVDLGPDAKGTVEKVTLRSTHLRDVNGTVWHVPNGLIQRAGNKSQEWARAVLDLEVDLDTDFESAEQVIRTVAETMAAEPDWAGEILDSPEVWGIESFTADGYQIRLVVKTRPASQFGIMRELRIRLKVAFDEAGIALPGSHPELWIHNEPDAPPKARHRSTAPPEPSPDEHPRRGDPAEA